MLRIEPVQSADLDWALALLVGGEPDTARRAEAFRVLLTGPEAARTRFWWARDSRPRAAALSLISAGRTAAVYYSAPRSPEDVGCLARLLEQLTRVTLDGGTVFVQTLLGPEETADAEAFLRAGYDFVAQLMYLDGDVCDGPEEPAGLTWRTFQPGDEQRLAETIADTYVDSRDCPDLLGLRRTSDVVAGHKASGIFRPGSWFLPLRDGECVGCVLVNDSAGRTDRAEVVYLGVRPAWRRQGMGRAMLRHALIDAARRGRQRVTLAVDTRNTPAVRLYHGEGFRQTDRRDVYIRVGQPRN